MASAATATATATATAAAISSSGGGAVHPKTTKPAALALRSAPRRPTAISTAVSPAARPADPTLKSRLAAGEPLYGLFLLSASPTLAEIAGLAGYDYVVVDMEHGPAGIAEALPCLRALAAARTPAVLRLPALSPDWTKKALDLGPQGLMFPSISSPEDAANAVSFCRFPPHGVRGAAHTVIRASSYGINDGYLEQIEDELFIMCQVETVDGIELIEGIAGVDGVDCVQMGPLDLSASMGYLWDPGHRNVRAALREAERRVLAVKKAAEKRGVKGPYLGGFAMPHDPPEELKKRGYNMVAGAVDLGMFRKAAVEDVARFRAAGEEGEEGEKPDDESYYSE